MKALRDEGQSTLEEMAADGTMAKISEKWFGQGYNHNRQVIGYKGKLLKERAVPDGWPFLAVG